MKRFLNKLKQVNIKDMGHLFLFLIALVPAWWMKKHRPGLWLICEYGREARDNGYWFYRYVRQQHKEQDIVYAIEPDAPDAGKVSALGQVIPYGGLKHWIYYLAAEVNISSHKGGKPNAAVCYLLEVYGILKNKRVFLQHGIIKDLADMFFYSNTKMRLFICGAKPEYEYVEANFGYPKGYVAYTGLARFDNLLQAGKEKKQILIAPTWRRWLYKTTSDPYENENKQAKDSEYVKTYKELLEDSVLENLLDEWGYELVFFPHRNMTELFEDNIQTKEHIRVETWKTADLQDLMLESECMITDYSSAVMDFAYMKKPVLYYQFDQEEFRQKHFEEGYFSYERDGFGPVVQSRELLYRELKKVIENSGKMEEIYEQRTDVFFPLRDRQNCQRIYQAIKEI